MHMTAVGVDLLLQQPAPAMQRPLPRRLRPLVAAIGLALGFPRDLLELAEIR